MTTTKDYVEEVLKENPKTRDNYNLLVIQTLRKLGLTIEVNESILETMPSIETITRVCREIQNQEQRLTPSESVKERRERKEKEFSNYYSGKGSNYATMKNSWMSQ